jgi:hypothetical protein
MYPRLPYPPRAYHICPCCSTEFGNDDADHSYEQLREMWVAGGANWFFGRPPEGWNPWLQLIEGAHLEAVPIFAQNVRTQAVIRVESGILRAPAYANSVCFHLL